MKNISINYRSRPGYDTKKIKPVNFDKPLVSIVTPFFNAINYFMETYNSVLNQSFPFWEWIIVNDGSTEVNTIEFLEKIAISDNRIKIINVSNGGPALARTIGAKESASQYLFFLDADDLIDKTMLECSYFCLERNIDAVWAYSNSIGFGAEDYFWKIPYDTRIEKKENILCVTSLIRKNNFFEAGGYDTTLKDFHEDWQLWLNFLSRGYAPAQMNFYGFWYRRQDGRLKKINTNIQKHKDSEQLIKKYSSMVKKNVLGYVYPNVSGKFKSSEYFKWDIKKYIFPKEEIYTIILTNDFNEEFLENIVSESSNIIIISTVELKKEILIIDKVYFYDLSSFLKPNDWLGFVDYLLSTRNVKKIIIDYSKKNTFFSIIEPILKQRHGDIFLKKNLNIKQDNENDEKKYIKYILKKNINIIFKKRIIHNINYLLFYYKKNMWNIKLYRIFIQKIKSIMKGKKNEKTK